MPEETDFPNPWVFDPRIRRTDDGIAYIAREVLVATDHVRIVHNRLRELGATRAEKTSPLDRYVTRYVLPLNDDGTEPDVIDVIRELRDLPGSPKVGPNHAYAGEPKIQGGPGGAPRPVGPLPGAAHTNGRAVRVAVLDTGLDPDALTLPIFQDHQRHGRHEPDAVYENRSVRQIGLMGGHGTAVASVVARYADQVQLSSVQVLTVAGTCDDWTLALGVLRAYDAGAEIISMSLGGLYDGVQEPLALGGVLDDLPPGAVLVAAAGNCTPPQQYFYPACRPGVISVAAIDTSVVPEVPAAFTNTGSWIVAGAPGVGIHMAYVFGSWNYGTAPLDFHRYVSWGGTSFATPFVTAQIAAATGLGETAADAAALLLGSLQSSPFQDCGKVYLTGPPGLVAPQPAP